MYGFYLSVVPDEFNVYWISYLKQDGAGIGPGACESGIRVFSLPEDVAKKIDSGGVSYLSSLQSQSKNNSDNWRKRYDNWQQTPIHVTRHWTDYMSLRDDTDYSKEKPSVLFYMDAHGCSPKIAQDVLELVDKAIVSKGNYYAQRSSGVMILIPSEKKAVYVFN